MAILNIYCDESCHLEYDGQSTMVLGAVWCPLEKRIETSTRIREIKKRHGLANAFAKKEFYLDLLDYFFDDDDLHFRALVVPDKGKLRHDAFDARLSLGRTAWLSTKEVTAASICLNAPPASETPEAKGVI